MRALTHPSPVTRARQRGHPPLEPQEKLRGEDPGCGRETRPAYLGQKGLGRLLGTNVQQVLIHVQRQPKGGARVAQALRRLGIKSAWNASKGPLEGLSSQAPAFLWASGDEGQRAHSEPSSHPLPASLTAPPPGPLAPLSPPPLTGDGRLTSCSAWPTPTHPSPPSLQAPPLGNNASSPRPPTSRPNSGQFNALSCAKS